MRERYQRTADAGEEVGQASRRRKGECGDPLREDAGQLVHGGQLRGKRR